MAIIPSGKEEISANKKSETCVKIYRLQKGHDHYYEIFLYYSRR